MKQAPSSWYIKIDTFFKQQGFLKSKNDSSLYIKEDKHGNVCLISLYVDDLIIIGGACQLVADIKINLSQEFEMKDLGDLHYCLGISFWGESGKTFSDSKQICKGNT